MPGAIDPAATRGKIYIIEFNNRYAIVVESGTIDRSGNNAVDQAMAAQIDPLFNASTLKAVEYTKKMDDASLLKSLKYFLASK